MTVESTTARKPRSGQAAQSAATGARTTRTAAAAAPATGAAGAANTAKAARTAAPAKSAKSARPAKGAKGSAAARGGAGEPAGTDARGAAQTAERPDDELVQLLTPEGERVARPDYDDYVADLTPETLRGLYRDMVLTRRFDGEATQLQRQGELGLWASLLGQEAAQIGSGRALRDDDYVFPTYREHGVAWCRGVDPVNLLGMFRGVNHGGWDPNSNNFHLYTIVIGSQTLHATGYAMGVAKDGAGSAVVAYFGDGASSQGDVAEAFTFSAVYNAPVVFFCQNNQWAISEPTERQTRVPLYQRARGYGFPGVRVDGNDVLACLAVTRAALEHSRGGAGPMLVEAFTYRMGAHTTSDDPTKYRSEDEREAWVAKDPILRLRRYLEREGYADEAFFAGLEDESEALGRHVRETVRAMPDPDPMAIFDNVYADGSAQVDEERKAFAAYQASFADGPDDPGGASAAGAGAEGGK
ncbi:pyruvate dehydrogenase (acetyl-transferring) E1 component subunit alpha [Streptomyces fuscigenes]|uniref:pyruvate dehydrogenase (acetyl-transferring) E1 component subunit alpha n=1 Tax=Streptomyces fuscigenes TaxID=1528880 RepID=UPI001F441006|nr:pyruvate dehydrogenase (acetyl-transferring) E1 component subunit alpha [Streptomyces fuscigenes]MCF3964846.1 pyruvate dehydrogenase (acetyl-transferring) E1 component subunit alpha [Streptomyces fuscigenes]